MDQEITRALYSLPPAEAYSSLGNLIQRLSSFENPVDTQTGAVAIGQSALADSVVQTLPLALAAPVLRGLRDIAADGFLVQNDKPVLPWRFLQSDEAGVLAPTVVQSLGINSSVAPDLLPLEILSRFPGAPQTVIEQAASNIAYGLQVAGPTVTEAAVRGPVIAARPTNGGDGGEGGGGGGGGIGRVIALTIEQIVQCITGGEWDLNWWGIRCGLNETCGRALGAALAGAALPTLISAIGAAAGAITAGVVAALGAAAAVAGGVWVLAAAIMSFLTGAAIEGAVTSAGVWLNFSWFLPIIVPTGR
jgi:hypothetical protein